MQRGKLNALQGLRRVVAQILYSFQEMTGRLWGIAPAGGHGTISVGSNIAPKAYAEFHNAMIAGDFIKAREMNAKLDRLHKDLFVDPSPAPAKYALSLMGKMNPTVRLPITECRDSTKDLIRSAMGLAGVDHA